VTDTVGQKDGR